MEVPKYHELSDNKIPNAPPQSAIYRPPAMMQNNLQPAMTNDVYTTQPLSAAVSRPPTAFIIVNSKPELGLESQRLLCPHCNVMMMTKLQYHAVFKTHIVAAALCLTGMIFLVPLPYMMKTCRRLDHYCTNCSQLIGKAH